MPLSPQLKSEMAGVPEEPKKKEPEKIVENPVKITGFETEEKPAEPVQPIIHTADFKAAEPEKESENLSAIEQQLEELNKNILKLGKEADLKQITAKIDALQEKVEKLAEPAPQPEGESDTDKLLAQIQTLIEKQEKNDRQLVQSLRETANFQIQVRQGMQKDLDTMKKQINGEQFNPLLKEIATIFVEYQTVLTDETLSDRSRKTLQSMFDQMEDLLTDYGAEVCRSETGSVRRARSTKIIEKILTGEQDKHNTIALSRRPGVVRDRVILYPEFVDVYVYDPTLDVPQPAAEEPAPAEETTEPVPVAEPTVETAAEPTTEIIPEPTQNTDAQPDDAAENQ